jgi:hypothetical protein
VRVLGDKMQHEGSGVGRAGEEGYVLRHLWLGFLILIFGQGRVISTHLRAQDASNSWQLQDALDLGKGRERCLAT